MKKNIIRKYARLIAVMGANIQKKQRVIISAAVDQHEFVTVLVDECYKAGASHVYVDWTSQELTKLHYRHQTVTTLSTVLSWEEERMKQNVKDNPARIHIASEDPMGLKGLNPQKRQKVMQKVYPIMKPYRDQLNGKQQWTIAAVPSRAWAKTVFPELSPHQAVEALWEAILASVRVTEDNDPIEAWKQHDRNFEARCAWLNSFRFDSIHYHSANGTDFTCKLIPESLWCGGGETSTEGIFFNPNMPTEEIFTTPMKGQCEGTLVSTKPLSYQGQLIDKFSIRFENGKAVEWHAEKGQELLDRMITMDEGACMLGELALIPMNSPINNSGILFYETLFDENASCHVALGAGYTDTIENYANRTQEEMHAMGVNDSMIHVDFMIGAADLCITGYKNGVATPIFVNGEWATEV